MVRSRTKATEFSLVLEVKVSRYYNIINVQNIKILELFSSASGVKGKFFIKPRAVTI